MLAQARIEPHFSAAHPIHLRQRVSMAGQAHRSWLMRKFESAIQRGFMRAYHQVRVDPARFLMHLRSAHSLPISGYEGVFQLDLRLLDGIAEETIHSSMHLVRRVIAAIRLMSGTR